MAQKPTVDMELYIDVEDALKRVCGNKAIYKKLLGKFKASLQTEALVESAAVGDFEAAAKIAHNIKGITANLSLPAAYNKCVQVEADLKQGAVNQSEVAKLREILETTLLCTEYMAETL
jgi:HPt (histidine-containing phosphotransfer) domain-containing protein